MTSRRRDNPEEDQPGVAAQTAREDDIAPKIPSAPLGGARLGHFRLIAELGRGGMGIVYRAEDEALRRRVAIKVLPSSTAGDEERRRRFLREARAAAAVSHPNIAIVHEVGEALGQAYIAMELVEGKSLAEVLAERRLSVEEALDFARQILRGLARAHEVGIIHRDLKPDNVMITPEGVAKVLDFGLAKPDELPATGSELGVAETITKVTEQGLVLGTPSYMSPEQARGGAVDRRSDLFSFGVMLYEMLAGQRPYGGSTNADILTAILRDPPPPLLTSNPEVSPALSGVVECCLAKEPEARYADCKSLMDALARASAVPLGNRPVRRSVPWQLVLSALGIVGLLSFGASLWRSASKCSLPAAPLSSAAPAAGPTAVTDLPSPVSTSQAAITAYRRGLEKLRLGADSASEFGRAVELDPSLAAAHLQLAAYGFINASEREHFHRAEELRSNLNPRDQALLDAIEPIVRRQPSDWGEATRRLTRALERFPHDAQLWYELALCRVIAGTERAVPAADRALAEDPSYVSALSVKGWDLAYNGEFVEAKGALEAAFRMAPTCWSCADNLGEFLMHEGACEDTERLARQVIATGSNLATGYEQLAASLAAQGKPVATVREAMKRAWPAVEERDRKLVERRDEIVTALFSGDFEVAEGSARALMQEVEPLHRQYEHGSAARWLVQILAETGRTAEAGRAAMDFLDRQDAWEPDPRAEDFAVGHDFTPLFLAAAQRAGLLRREELMRRRAVWMVAWERKIAPAYRNYLWLQGYASIVETEADAKDAIEALPKYTPIPPFRPFTLSWMGVGPAYLLTGRVEQAVSWLSKVTKVCSGLYFPVEHTRAHAWLGQALEQKGEKAGACAAYQVVLSRWGEAKQRSTTAEKVRARAKALGCGR